MKKILITGAGSYIGVSFENYLKQFDGYETETVDMLDPEWDKKSFEGFDAVFHVAGIAHIKETEQNRDLYYKVNRDLAVKTADKAKNEGVKQFVFLSTMSVYGLNQGVITAETEKNPNNAYGKSKLMAEEKITEMRDSDFTVSVVRPPMVYGKGCKGNFNTVVKLASKSPIFPSLKNQRSMIFIDNLCEFVKQIIDNKTDGVFCPQNREYVNTTNLARKIAQNKGKKVWFSRLAGIAVIILRPLAGVLQKAFGTLIYKDLEQHDFKYCVTDFEESVKKSL